MQIRRVKIISNSFKFLHFQITSFSNFQIFKLTNFQITSLIFKFLIFITMPGFAADLRFDHLSMKDGLSMNPVISIVQDPKGFLWFGTQDGLNRYDGNKFHVFKTRDDDSTSLSDNFITSQCIDNQGNLWAGTHNNGVNRLDLQTGVFKRFLHDPQNHNSLIANRVFCLFPDKEGLVWVGTQSGISMIDPVTLKLVSMAEKYPALKNLRGIMIFTIYQNSDGNFLFGTSIGLHVFNPFTNKFKSFSNDPLDKSTISNDMVLTIFQDSKKRIWVGTIDGLNLFDPEKGTFKVWYFKREDETSVRNSRTIISNSYSVINNYNGNTIRCIVEDHTGRLWIGTDMELIILNPETGIFKAYHKDIINPSGINDHFIRSMFIDRSNNLWIGSLANGINKTDLKPVKFIHYKREADDTFSIKENYVRSFAEDKTGRIWIGAIIGGLDYYDPQKNKICRFYKTKALKNNKLNDPNVWSLLYEENSDVLWAGTNKGINKINLTSGEFSYYIHDPASTISLSENTVRCIFRDKKGRLWVGTEGGLNLLNQDGTFTHFMAEPGNANSLSDNTVWKIVEDNNGYLWIATNDGLNRMDPGSRTFVHFKKEQGNIKSLSHNGIRTLHIDMANNLWVGTQNGLNKMDPVSETFTRFDESNGLANGFIYAIEEDDNGNLWLSSNRGISCYEIKNNKFINYDIFDGLQDYEFNTNAVFKSARGEMFFGGPNGINRFNPLDIYSNKFKAQIEITLVKILDKVFSPATMITEVEEINLNYDENILYFEFASLEFTNPVRNQFAYKMEGFNKDWVFCGNSRFITYTNLDPGEYTFFVKTSNSDGVWNPDPDKIKIIIHPPFWKTNWFYSICIISVVASAYGFYTMRLRNLKREKKLLERKVNERTLALQKEKNKVESANLELEKSEKIIREKNKDITDSINYAQKIQRATLPYHDDIINALPGCFIFFKPRDIVSGDFYWFSPGVVEPSHFIAAVDCTGHGIPGAFMSLIGNMLLNEILNEKKISNTGKMIDELDRLVKLSLKQDLENGKDGMDLCLVKVMVVDNGIQLEYSGANRPLYLIRNKELIEFAPDKNPVGGYSPEGFKFFSTKIDIKQNDVIYLFTDGYPDQFGGEKGKKYMTKRLKQLLIEISDQDSQTQRDNIEKEFFKWKGAYDQIDDVLIIGVKF